MSEFQKVKTFEDLQNLDPDEVYAGYVDGMTNPTCPGSDKSRSFWHGWRNARMDKGEIPQDSESSQLAHEYLENLKEAHLI